MSSFLEQSILKTLIYADLFDYPLTEEEIWDRLIKVKSPQHQSVRGSQKSPASVGAGQAKVKSTIRELKKLKTPQGWPDGLPWGGESSNYLFLPGREHIISIRKKRVKYSQEKLKIAKETASLLRFIPSVKLVGVTGALAVSNAEKNDDIDFFIVTSKGLLWTTRLLVVLLTELIGKRRHPGVIEVKDKICLNMFMDEDHLAVPKEERDLYSAHEVIQMKPLSDKGQTYQKFIHANLWVKDYLPNAIRIKNALKTPRGWQAESHDSPEVEKSVKPYFSVVEHLFESLQLWYMKRHRTTEVITDGVIRFHPQDARKWVLRNYKERLKRYKVV